MPSSAAPTSELARLGRGARVQLRVIGAIALRELHTRFGRNNIGYLWLVMEPMILALGISVIHLVSHISLSHGFQPATFYASGYIVYIAFRNNVNRGTSLIEGNKPLLYHKQVTLMDLSLGRSFLESIAVFGALVTITTLFVVMGLADPPQRPALLVLGLFLMSWLSAGAAMIIGGAAEFSPLVERFIHPATYLMLPVSGMFFVLDDVPPSLARIIAWLAIPQIQDIVRMGLRTEFESTYVNYPYVVLVCALMTLFGLLFLRAARRRIHFE